MDKSTLDTQLRKTYKAFKGRPKTTKMVAVETGIQRSNITRYVAQFEKLNLITIVKTAPCEITKHKAKYYSTERKYLEPETQVNLFPSKHAGPYSL